MSPNWPESWSRSASVAIQSSARRSKCSTSKWTNRRAGRKWSIVTCPSTYPIQCCRVSRRKTEGQLSLTHCWYVGFNLNLIMQVRNIVNFFHEIGQCHCQQKVHQRDAPLHCLAKCNAILLTKDRSVKAVIDNRQNSHVLFNWTQSLVHRSAACFILFSRNIIFPWRSSSPGSISK